MTIWGDRRVEAQRVRVLMVCEANICRSPMAMQLFRRELRRTPIADLVEVESAGVSALVGAPMDERAAEQSWRLGGEPSMAAVARRVDGTAAAWSDLVLTMTRDQRNAVAHEFPRLLKSAFTLVEFAELAEAARIQDGVVMRGRGHSAGLSHTTAGHDASNIVRLIAAAARNRGALKLGAEGDIEDPYGRSTGVYESVADRIDGACSRIVRSFAAAA